MSIINDALKKAQRERGSDKSAAPIPAATPVAQPAPTAERREKSSSPSHQALIVGGFSVLLVAVLAIGGVLIFRSSSSSAPATPKPNVAATKPTPSAANPSVTSTNSGGPGSHEAASIASALPTPAQVATSPAASASSTITPPSTAIVSVPVTPAAKPDSTNSGGPSSREAAPQFTLPLPSSAPAQAEAKPDEPARIAAAPATNSAGDDKPKPSARMISVIDSLRVTGIRASGSDSKVLMNDRVYRLNDIVDAELGLRLTSVTQHSLTFVDSRGATHTKNF